MLNNNSLEQTLKQEYAYVKIQNFLITHSYLFSDAEFKVVMALYSMLDFRFEFTFVPVSRRELSIKTGKARGKIYQILKSLEDKGIIKKISGAKNKELAFRLREKFYKQKQNKIRSYNEKNVYDLKPLLEMATFLMAKLSEFQDEEMFMNICLTALTTYKNSFEPLFIKLLKGFKDAGFLNQMAIDSNQMAIDSNQMAIDSNQMAIDSNQMAIDKQKPITSNITNNTHTHHTPTADFEEKEKEIGSPKSEIGNSNATDLPEFSDKKVLNIDDKLKEFIITDLIRQEQEGKINSANAIFKSLSAEDIQLYKQKFERKLKQKQSESYKILALSRLIFENELYMKELLGRNYKEILEKKRKKGEFKEYSQYVYILTSKQSAYKVQAIAKKLQIDIDVREFDENFEKIFKR